MGYRRFADSWCAVGPVRVTLENILLPRIIGYPVREVIVKRLVGAVLYSLLLSSQTRSKKEIK